MEWQNVGGQLIPSDDVQKAIRKITSGNIRCWKDVHDWYKAEGEQYEQKKYRHAFALLKAMENKEPSALTMEEWGTLFSEAIQTRKWLSEEVYLSRKKDYTNPFRQMMYDSHEEMEKVLGKIDENEFIVQEKESCKRLSDKMKRVKKQVFQ